MSRWFGLLTVFSWKKGPVIVWQERAYHTFNLGLSRLYSQATYRFWEP
jgi:hypothetical protein